MLKILIIFMVIFGGLGMASWFLTQTVWASIVIPFVIIILYKIIKKIINSRKIKKLYENLGPEAPILDIDGFQFRDLNKNGKLDVYEDSRQSVEARVENANYQLKPGFFVDVKLFLDINESAMVLPEGAVVVREGRHVVLMVQGEKIIIKSVILGKRFDGKVEILDGIIDKDDLVVVSGLSELVEGSRVKVVNHK